MRAFALSGLATLGFWFFQNVDFFAVVDKYGFPTAVTVFVFIYLSRQINKKDQESNGYRAEVLAEQKDQTNYLRSMLAEQKKAAICKFEEQHAAALKKYGRTE